MEEIPKSEMAHVVKNVFGIVDYAVFSVMLLISAGIGVWYAVANRRKSNTQEFLMGGRSLSVFPVAMSVLASFMSAITLLGTPAEVYRYGTQYLMINIAFCLVVPATAYLYVPVFYNLGVTSAYEYLELRFSSVVRTAGSVVFFLHMMMYMPVVLYAPALALSEVTGIDLWTAILSLGLVCTFYTSIGGMKAVVLTDFFQSIMMYASILVILVKGTIDLGGFNVIWERAVQGHRIEFFRFDLDPTVRHTFWSLVVGGYVTWMGNYAANQAMIQRYLTIGSLRGAQGCLWINLPALIILVAITGFSGLVIFAYYHDCDPIGTKMIAAEDQLFPRFVMETLGAFPGIPGLFVSGIFSGALSTVSSGVNSLAAVTLEDFVKPFVKKDLSEVMATRLTKTLAMTYGLASIALVFVAEQLGGVLQAAFTIHGIVGGPMLGVFTLGMFFPCANATGAAAGLISGFVMAMWFGMGAFASQPFHPEAPRSYENCTELFDNATSIYVKNITIGNNDDIFPPYRLSYLWLSAVGFIVVLVIGLAVSFITGATKGDKIDQRLLSPFILWLSKHMPGSKVKKIILHGRERRMQFMLLFSRQGKLRLQKWYVAHPDRLKKKITRELVTTILTRKPKMCSFLEWRELKVVYKRYASLYFCCAVEQCDNELLTLEIIHRYVELLDKYFGSVCELDIIFNFEKAYFILDELLLGGEIQETSKKNVLKAIAAQDLLQEEETPQGFFEDHGLG